ncbi:MAG: flagellar hook protein FlgE [Armatimonadetes bacterium]|nr:flagellar hook protein FlgE [Armatimonadota bacterium]MCX7969069.1 flagellar hook protein FlgE [Armatimonadota bacterium]MDW8142929.1 flagellar hook protein FlgE [Armatimonadota bacterium]
MGVIHTALSALSSYDLMLQVTANNLANLNTPGFKSQSLHFLDTFYQTLQAPTVPIGGGQGGKNPIQVGMGVAFGAIITRLAQGTFTPTGMSTDMAIIGNGFFAVSKNGQILYTRDGAFRVDADGNLVHAGTGAFLLGWLADEAGNINSASDLQRIKIPVGGALAARATSVVRLGGNLDARMDTGSTLPISFTVYDSQGNNHLVQLIFVKTAPNTWDWQAEFNGSVVGSGAIQFNEYGQWQSGTGTITLNLTNGALSPQSIQLDFSSINQLASTNTASVVFQDGFTAGVLETISVDARGIVLGSFSNGITRPLAQVAVAVFSNPEGLERIGDNMFKASGNSGMARYLPPTVGGAGRVQSSGLEQSNVDLARELTQVLIAQRSFQAAARTILAADEMTQEALNLRR